MVRRQMERDHTLEKKTSLTSQLLRFWKKKYRAAAHTTAVATMQKSGMGRTFSELRSCGREAEAAGLPAPPATGPGAAAPSCLAYLHDDVEGQVEQQVTDEDAQHVGGKVPGPVDQSKEGAEHTGRNYFAATKVDL